MMDRKGAVGLVVGIAMFAMVASVAMGIDFSRTYLTRVRLQTAIDAAALTAGREVKSSSRNADATLVFWQNFAVNHITNGLGPVGSQTPGPKITFINASTLNISATANVPMVFAKIFGWNQIPVTARAQVVAAGGGLEVALVLDNTNSLGPDGIAALQTGATNLVETVYGDSTTTTTTWVSVVPFGGEVNIGSVHKGWLDSSANISTLRYGQNGWGGCVFARYASDGTADMSENPPVSSYRFQPFFWPSTYQKTPYSCSWFGCGYLQGDNDWSISGGPGITETAPITLSASGPPNVSADEVGPNLGCPPLALLPETASKATVETEISLMPMLQRGGTLIQNALQTGWFTISPKWKRLWSQSLPDMPYDYGQSSTKKILVLMTDGTNQMCPCFMGYPDYNANVWAGWWNSDETAFGRLLDNKLATVNGYYNGFQDVVRPILDNLVLQVCSNMKAVGIDIYVILYTHQGSSVDDAAINTMKACVTDSHHYFESPSAADMQAAFSRIAGEISALRLAQ
ncbi:Tad domain-containing protein [Acetobacter fabarum]|uniref:TadE/TadG family type IV pilus assembly protein n=1 Tax=Acetobacter fabarum TaxID=483199 RepID=UPI00312B7854